MDRRKRYASYLVLTDPGVKRVRLGVHVDTAGALPRLFSDQRLESECESSGRSRRALEVKIEAEWPVRGS